MNFPITLRQVISRNAMIRKLIHILLFIQVGSSLFAQKSGQECFPPQDKDRLVYDLAGMMSAGEMQAVESMLEQFAVQSSNEIFVVVVPDLCGMDKSQFAIELGEKWRAGQKAEDNGIIVLIKPKTASEKGEVFIAIGRGLEGAIPDATAHMIIENEMLPEFKNGKMYAGLQKALTTLMALSSGEYNSDAYTEGYRKRNTAGGVLFIVILIIIGIYLLMKRSEVKKYALLNNLGFWQAWVLLNSMNRQHGGTWSDFSGGRGHFRGFGGGGSSGGGFGGFGGGGSFGGGGAGGSW